MKKKNLFISLYLICTLIITISAFLPHIYKTLTATGEPRGFYPGIELLGAPFFMFTVILLIKSKIREAFVTSLVGCLLIGLALLLFWGFIFSMDYMTNKSYITYTFYPSIFTGLISYIILLLLTILMTLISEFKE